jgi:hypothetical protein
MTQLIFLYRKQKKCGYSARALGESVFTQAETIKELKAQISDAILCHFGKNKLPKSVRLKRVKNFSVK